MNEAGRSLRCVFIFCCLSYGCAELGLCQAGRSQNAAVTVQRIMATELSRCHTTGGGIKAISFVPAANEEIAEIKVLGEAAVYPLAKYLNADPKDGFTQLFAVKFLMVIGGSASFAALERAFANDQWEVTRATALSGMFAASPVQTNPYIDLALHDKSQLVQRQARQMCLLYQQQTNGK
jgi:hypothetical protein